MRSIIGYSVLWSVCMTLMQCANIGQPDGGPRDTTPPGIDTANSTPAMQKNFRPDQTKIPISLKFDEWIKLDNAFKQVVISPPLQYAPKIELKGKGVQIKLDPREVLKEQTTYTVNFGQAIKDITENNVVKNLRFVFSTGDIIDTGYVAGKVRDAYTGETKEELLVMLYESDADSVVYKQRPTYFSRTDKEGNFSIENIKDTSYQLFVLEDANSNYIYDQDKEHIGFAGRRVVTGEDSTTLQIRYFASFIKPKLTGTSTEIAGVVKIQSNIPLTELKTLPLSSAITQIPFISKDTLMVYYLPSTQRDWPLEVRYNDLAVDTILVNKIRKERLDSFVASPTYRDQRTLTTNDFVKLDFNHPLGIIDTSGISLIDDTTLLAYPIILDSATEINQLGIQCPCIEGSSYSLVILPGAVKNFASTALGDTLRVKIKGLITDQSGSIVMEIKDLDSSAQYKFSLMQEEKIIRNDIFDQKSTMTLTYLHLPPSNYTYRIIEDLNKNGRWDTGDFIKKLQPEKILTKKNYSVRANWELRETINWIK